MLRKLAFMALVFIVLAGCQQQAAAPAGTVAPTEQKASSDLGVEEINSLNQEIAPPENIETELDQVNW
ncbi:MAG TPA: hypothetical protein VFF28_02365 [Candidatus Nanoarchaeia archaeon]|nr:hypothetical protein [Candidatus Nanoarchaeia archaeon]